MQVVGTPEHNFVELNSFELFALRGGGEQKTRFLTARALSRNVNFLSAYCDAGKHMWGGDSIWGGGDTQPLFA